MGRRLGMAALLVAAAFLAADVTITNVAIPTIATELDASVASLEWVVDSCNITVAGLLLLVAGAGALPAGRNPDSGPLDVVGALRSMLGLGLLLRGDRGAGSRHDQPGGRRSQRDRPPGARVLRLVGTASIQSDVRGAGDGAAGRVARVIGSSSTLNVSAALVIVAFGLLAATATGESIPALVTGLVVSALAAFSSSRSGP